MTENTPPAEAQEDVPLVQEDNRILLEEEESFWYVAGKFLWGSLRTLLFLGIVGLILWLIWGSDSLPSFSSEEEPTQEEVVREVAPEPAPVTPEPSPTPETEPETEEESSETVPWWERVLPAGSGDKQTKEAPGGGFVRTLPSGAIFGRTDSVWDKYRNQGQNTAVSRPTAQESGPLGLHGAWHAWVDQFATGNVGTIPLPTEMRSVAVGVPSTLEGSQSALALSLGLLRESQQIFTRPLRSYVEGATLQQRRQRITQFEGQLTRLIGAMGQASVATSAAFEQASAQAARARDVSTQTRTQVNASLHQFVPFGVDETLARHIEAENARYRAASEAEAHRIVANKLRQYQETLQNVRQNLQANRAALEAGVQVVQFPQDTFGRILTPAQWRSLGE